jgi:hypothetical protein
VARAIVNGECKMKSLNTKLVLSALGIVAMLTSPAFANQTHRPSQQRQITSDPAPQIGRGIYNMVPNQDDPTATGGGSSGYNQSLRENHW